MTIAEFQRAYTDMTLDVRLARRVRHDGEAALAAYALDRRESARLARVARQPGMALNCTLARANRFTSIADAFPRTCVLLEPWLRTLLDELWSAGAPRDYQLRGEVDLFAACVRRDWLPRGTVEYLDEVFAYEQACRALLEDSRRATLAGMRGDVRRVAFRHDPGALLPPLDAAVAPPAGLPEAPHWVDVEIVDEALETRWQPA
jgi:hypothetical protein